jgi:hypothetical protein
MVYIDHKSNISPDKKYSYGRYPYPLSPQLLPHEFLNLNLPVVSL